MRRLGVVASIAVALFASGVACNVVLGLDNLQPLVDAAAPDGSSGGPVRIANPSTAPTCLVLQSDRIFYCVGQRVIVANRDGSEQHDFVPIEGGAAAFAVGPLGACWTSNGSLMGQALDASAPTTVVEGGVLDSVACAGPYAYFAAGTDGGVELRRVRLDVPGAPAPLMNVTSLDSMAASGLDMMVADENRVSRIGFFGVDDAGNPQLDGATVTSLAATSPHRVAGGDASAYWIRGTSTNVDMTSDFATTQVVPVAHTPSAIAVYGTDVYTVSESDGLVLRRTPTDTKIIATGQTGVRLIAVDDTAIVWATATAIFMLPRN